MQILHVDNYAIEKPLIEIIYDIKSKLINGKLKDIIEKGDEIVITCPNDTHDNGCEQNPDCHINILKPEVPYGTFNCFACGTSGSFVKFVALCFSASIDYAKNFLITNYGIKVQEKIFLGDDICINKAKKKEYLDEYILDQYQPYCDYLQKRKLSREACELFNVKYDPYKREILFPCYNEYGKLVSIPSRKVDYKGFHLQEGKEKIVYGLDKIMKNNYRKAVICEGQIDCLTFWTMHVPAIATMGLVDKAQIDKINKSCISTLYLAMDNDEAGRKFTKFIKENLSPRIITVDINFPTHRKDVNELTMEERSELIEKYNLKNF